MTNRPSEILKAALHPDVCVSGHAEKLYSILDSHAARLESLERDREAVRAQCEWAANGTDFVDAKAAAAKWLAENTLRPAIEDGEWYSADKGSTLYCVNGDATTRWYGGPDAWSTNPETRTDNLANQIRNGHAGIRRITREEAEKMNPAIATRWAEASPPAQSEQPGKGEGGEAMALEICDWLLEEKADGTGTLKRYVSSVTYSALCKRIMETAKQYAASREARIAALEAELASKSDSEHGRMR